MTDKNRPSDNPSASEFIANSRRQGAGLLGPHAKVIPYIGVTGFMTATEVESARVDMAFGCDIESHQLAVGLLASWKTLTGQPAGQPKRYPKIEDLRAILDSMGDSQGGCLRMIHYNSREPNLIAQIDQLCHLAGPNLDGFQLNIHWPDQGEIRCLASDYPGLRFILQVSATMYASVGRDPERLAAKIEKDYGTSITDVLFDMSGGTGQPIDLNVAEKAIEVLYTRLAGANAGGIGIGVAGGLDEASALELRRLFERWSDLSIDAEDTLIVDKVTGYVRAAPTAMSPRHQK